MRLVKGTTYSRDDHSKAFVNKGLEAHLSMKARKEAELNDKRRLDKVERDVSDIKRMLEMLISNS
jgi:hypothetical protein